MKDLFQHIVDKGESAINDLIQQKVQEDFQLEFKTKRSNRSSNFSDDDTENLGKTLSAFSNSMGGLMVWGVEAKKDPESNIDCACDLKPIPNIESFKSEVLRKIGQIITPRNDGIIVESISTSSADGNGYLLILVERSERRPHRSEAKGDKKYYKRVGDSSYAMEHYDIEDAFKRYSVAELDVFYQFTRPICDGNEEPIDKNLVIELILCNNSNMTAKFPYIYVEKLSRASIDNYGLDGSYTFGLSLRKEGEIFCFEGGANEVIHPGAARKIARIKIPLQITVADRNINNSGRRAYYIDAKISDKTIIEYSVGCDNSRMKRGFIEISAKEIAENLLSISSKNIMVASGENKILAGRVP